MVSMTIIGYIFFLPAFILPYFIGIPDLPTVLSNPITIAIAMLSGIIAIVYMRKYPLYHELLKDKISKNSLTNTTQAMARNRDFSMMDFNDAQKWSKHVQTTGLIDDKFKNKEGFAYLNAIFFDRHKKYFRDKLLLRSMIFVLPTVAVIIFFFINPLTDNFESSRSTFESMFTYSPIFFFLIYLFTMGKLVTASVFSNCDIQMLNYPYYRTKETIIASFKSRFAMTLKYSLALTTVITIAVLAAVTVAFKGMDFRYAGAFFVLMTSIGVLFAFNDLFLYYVMQPYDSDGKSTVITYKFTNIVIYFLAYINFQARFELFTYTFIMCAVTVLYIVIGMFLMQSLAPKNFRLK